MDNKIGWAFPRNDGGEEKVWNHEGLTHFQSSPFSHLAREIIQNSLDAALSNDKPVSVVFEIRYIKPEILGCHELLKHVEACRNIAMDENDNEKNILEIESALNILKSGEDIECLVISDRNTTGLVGKNFHALTKTAGKSIKFEGSGGSHGIGKNAAFVCSALRTVFYWTSFTEGGKRKEKMQGKSILMSHQNEQGDMTQNVGFYGISETRDSIKGKDNIDDVFRRIDPGKLKEPVDGTSVIITGFKKSNGWRDIIAASVISNFFYAIDNGKLEVTIEPEQDETETDFEINKNTVGKWCEKLLASGNESFVCEYEETDIQLADMFRKAYLDREPDVRWGDESFGEIKLYIYKDRGMPSKVGIVRKSGMKITDEQPMLKRFSRCQPFICLILIEDIDGNSLLKQMENPSHNEFNADWLPENKKEHGRYALSILTKTIRSKIQELAAESLDVSDIHSRKLSELLPDIEADDVFDTSGDKSNWRDIDVDSKIGEHKPKPNGSGRTPSPVESSKVKLSNVRIFPESAAKKNVSNVVFISPETCKIELKVLEAGDSNNIVIENVKFIHRNGEISDTINVEAGIRNEITLECEHLRKDRAYILLAHKVTGDNKGESK